MCVVHFVRVPPLKFSCSIAKQHTSNLVHSPEAKTGLSVLNGNTNLVLLFSCLDLTKVHHNSKQFCFSKQPVKEIIKSISYRLI